MHYQQALKNRVTVPQELEGVFGVYHNFVLLTKNRDALAQYLQEQGVDTRVHYPVPLHLQPAAKMLGYQQGDFPVAEALAKEMLSLPVHPELSDESLQYVIKNIKAFYEA
jgi:dTDP-4-amino-4,6-dideoxygalactose transaminase